MGTVTRSGKPAPSTAVAGLRQAVLFDVDGTLANVSAVVGEIGHPFDPTPENLNRFHALAEHAPPHSWVVNFAHAVQSSTKGLVVLTARSERYRPQTERWLNRHDIHPDALHMRPNRDLRSDAEVKEDILRDIRKRWDIVHALDDNPSIVALLHRLGIPTTVVPGWPIDPESLKS